MLDVCLRTVCKEHSMLPACAFIAPEHCVQLVALPPGTIHVMQSRKTPAASDPQENGLVSQQHQTATHRGCSLLCAAEIA